MRARKALCGAHVAFVGNSMQRRAMFSLADLLGGENATRRGRRRDLGRMEARERAGALSFDTKIMAAAKALNSSNTIIDYPEGNHAFQYLSVSCATGLMAPPVTADDYCGTPTAMLETRDDLTRPNQLERLNISACSRQRHHKCRVGLVPCSVTPAAPPRGTIGLSFTFLGTIGLLAGREVPPSEAVESIVRQWAAEGHAAAGADVVVLSPKYPSALPRQLLASVRSALRASPQPVSASRPDSHPGPLWVVKETPAIGTPSLSTLGTATSVAGFAQHCDRPSPLRHTARDNMHGDAVLLLAQRATAEGLSAGVLTHEQGGYHYMDSGR